jgi:hypothetical protein
LTLARCEGETETLLSIGITTFGYDSGRRVIARWLVDTLGGSHMRFASRIRALALALGALALSASVVVAGQGISTASGHVTNDRAIEALATAAAAGGAAAASSADALADAWAAANAGLDKAVDAIESNSTDADAGALDAIASAREAIAAGLAHAAAGADNAGDHPADH